MFQRLIVPVAVVLCMTVALRAQEAHWGLMGSGAYTRVPEFLIDLAEEAYDFRELTNLSLEGATFNVGVVRFNDRGAPNFALQFSRMELDITGDRTVTVA